MRALPLNAQQLADDHDGVFSRKELRRSGVTLSQELAQVRAHRWTSYPPNAVVLHNGPLTRAQQLRVALANCGDRSALCARTALEVEGLQGWARDQVEVLVTKSTEVRPAPGVRVHESRRFDPMRDIQAGRVPRRTRPARSAVDAAAWSSSPRTAVGLLAAVVQQGLARADDLALELARAGKVRHHRLLAACLADIAGGARALSEIDFGALCRRWGLPEPIRQSVRVEPSGRRRYLDAEWVTPDGRRVVAEVDGAIHMLPRQYWDDMVRANELVLTGTAVLRFAAYAVRAHPDEVAAQLRRALLSG